VRPVVLLAATLWVLASAGVASAHGAVGSGVEAPIPLGLLYAGAGGTVALTAGWLAVGDRAAAEDRDTAVEGTDGRSFHIPFWLAQILRSVGRSLGLIALASVLVAGVFGPQIRSANVATVLFWPVWLKGLGVVAVVLGSPWRVVSPWGTLYDVLARLEGAPPQLLGSYPERLGEWPAVVGFALLVGVAENLTTLPRSPRLTAALVAGYALVMLLGALAFGPTWLRRADALAVLYRLLGVVAPVAVARETGGYRVSLRAPWRSCTRSVADVSTVAFVVLALYTVSFDGLAETAAFQTPLAATRGLVGPVAGALALYIAGFGLFLGGYWLAVALADRAGGESGRTAFAASLLPIAAAYEVAHTYPFVLRNAGRLVELTTAGAVAIDPVAGLSVSAFWVSQVVLVVVGHLVAVVAAHSAAVRRYGVSRGRRVHAPLAVVMVGYTVCSLWILSQPLAN
jgi:hypothetical protein